ncbi:LEAF RUST 10 DISEASE-RESISTANCE LOCUS RECEPTOR-LIKE PROTEIN KINASE-like 2.4 [Cannabis sativa]|uniref:LEAF RUST 10 DISEASE-RESISTANCE LOCUS RECEPTOR-LIKE PROTEIN KINASE-like 2.4 n=1 Tax=Cannabis sativa TaxID=3483 RepID=UPI0029C9B751|nr:LEAF RUST 10 DISEASE-RESISTANCE LOCUS RECEPTOR-LIKE PROTEIN KINASE-like 2.4 [Cannabis sativa]
MQIMLENEVMLFIILAFQSIFLIALSLSLDCNVSLFSCGNITNIDFPFWGESRPLHCGYPRLKLNCYQNQTTIELANIKYNVFELNKSSRILKLERSELFRGICSPGSKGMTGNIDLMPGLLEYAPGSGNMSFFYNCTKHGGNSVEIGDFSCPNGSIFKNGYYGLEMESRRCSWNVSVGIESRGIGFAQVDGAVRQGFQVSYTEASIGNCTACISKFNGFCDYDYNSTKFLCHHPKPPHQGTPWKHYWTIAGVSLTAIIGVIAILIVFFYKRKSVSRKLISKKKRKRDRFHVEDFIKNNYASSFTLKRYTYANVKRMTNSFVEKIGEGGFSIVYKGHLSNGTIVAIKVLKEAKSNGQDFINEVASIGAIMHKNVVSLLGFCYEGNRRALIYEYMPKGSLDKFIFNHKNNTNTNNSRLEWKTLYEIAIGIARGLKYLHQDCSATILHFDIKPHNILLDFDFCPKISDFGLAKLWQRDGSGVSLLKGRGTIGYTAPEMHNRNFGEVSYKSDVYSYGMMVLEMVGGRKNIDTSVSRTSAIYYPHWAHKHVNDDDDGELLKNICEEIMENEDDEMMARKMIIVSLWCIQAMPFNRPSMFNVVQMMEGSLESLHMPPKPILSLQKE